MNEEYHWCHRCNDTQTYKKCNRCGETFMVDSTYGSYKLPTVDIVNAQDTRHLFKGHSDRFRYYDVCPKCASELSFILKDWLHE